MEDFLEARAGETDAHYFVSGGLGLTHVDDFTLGLEVGIAAADEVILIGDADFEIAADGYVEAGAEGGAAAT
jgi:hypothetical protein